MACRYGHITGDSGALLFEPSSADRVDCRPSMLHADRENPKYHTRHVEVREDADLDPFYLESFLVKNDHDTRYRPEQIYGNYAPLNVSFTGQRSPATPNCQPAACPDIRKNFAITLDTFQRVAENHENSTLAFNTQTLHCRQDSFGSMKSGASTPDLTPSSSFSSDQSPPPYPVCVQRERKQLSFETTTRTSDTRSDAGRPFFLPPSTPPPVQKSRLTLFTAPSTPTRGASPVTAVLEEVSERFRMDFKTHTMSSSGQHRSKPLPAVPPLKLRHSNAQFDKQARNRGPRGPIDPSIISPPSLIDPVTLEPHSTHFDQAFFIPAHDLPSPVPSPAPSSHPVSREAAFRPSRDRPPTPPSDAHHEQSVWESDSDTEATSPRSRSRRKPIDTLRKVRSKVQLRVARSATKLNPAGQHEQVHERFPSLDDSSWREPSLDETLHMILPRPRDTELGSSHRLAVSSTRSLAESRSRNAGSAQAVHDVDIRPKPGRRPRCQTTETYSPRVFEQSSLRHGRCSDAATLHEPPVPGRPALFTRVLASLCVLGCRKDTANWNSTYKPQ